jgi:predicted aminopeptidase
MPDAPADQASAATRSAAEGSSTRASMHRSSPSDRVPRSGSALAAALLCASLAPLLLPGCYYAHLATGQLRLLLGRSSVAEVASDPATPTRVREQLALVDAARSYAAELGLDVGRRYTSYVEWPGDRVVTIVVATRPGEVEAAGFDFPLVGRVPYKGFFDLESAEDQAAQLRARGLDVCVIPVRAYSTLGWFDDPLTTPMLEQSQSALAETVIHELVHSTVFVTDQPEFNEGVARYIGQEASVRLGTSDRQQVNDDRLVASVLLDFQHRVAKLYEGKSDELGRDEARERLESELRVRVAALTLDGRDPEALSAKLRLNDACLAARGTYAQDGLRHEQVLQALDGDLQAFVRRLRESAEHADPRSAFFETELLFETELPFETEPE